MSNRKDKHIEELMKQAESFPGLKTSDSFLDILNSRLDELGGAPKQATIFTFHTIAKYAAVLAIIFLNVGVVYTQLQPGEIETETIESVTEIASEYFPDYTSYIE